MNLPQNLQLLVEKRMAKGNLRKLILPNDKLVDFSSNDYLGFASSSEVLDATNNILGDRHKNGSTGSRLLTGHSSFFSDVEFFLSQHYGFEDALIYNSGLDANLGLISAVVKKNDLVFYDEFCHASIRQALKLTHAKSYKFKHNNLSHLKRLLGKFKSDTNTFIITESVFSMDGDSPDLECLVALTKTHNALLIVDEAHAVGVFRGGLIKTLSLEKQIFASVVTFGKAMGCHGAAVLGSHDLKNFLINFSFSQIYTTSLPPYALANILASHKCLEYAHEPTLLKQRIGLFKILIKESYLNTYFIESVSAIQSCILGLEQTRVCSDLLIKKGYLVKPILSPTVPQGKERLRFCLHSFNSEQQIRGIVKVLKSIINT